MKIVLNFVQTHPVETIIAVILVLIIISFLVKSFTNVDRETKEYVYTPQDIEDDYYTDGTGKFSVVYDPEETIDMEYEENEDAYDEENEDAYDKEDEDTYDEEYDEVVEDDDDVVEADEEDDVIGQISGADNENIFAGFEPDYEIFENI